MKDIVYDRINALIRNSEYHYFAECMELPVVARGRNLEEVVAHLKKEIAIYMAGEFPEKSDFIDKPRLIITLSRCRWDGCG
ncbi:MAG: hypothetical protein ACLPX5_07355 [Dissulfurispiraceae bacterium]